MNPLGGLPRRKKVLEKLAGAALVVDAGNALFRAAGLDDDASKKRARFILDTMGGLGTQVMAVGTRDLVAGLPWLVAAAKGNKMKLLSANLRDQGKAPFEPSAVLKSGSTRVAFIGVSPAETGLAPLAAVTDEVKKLKGKADVIVVLAAVPYADALQISTELKGQIDFVLQSSESRASFPQLSEGNVVIGSGERGRTVGKLTLGLSGRGPWVNLDQANNDKAALDSLDQRIKELKDRRAAITDKKALADFDGTLADFNKRRAELQKAASAATASGSRTFKAEWVSLDASVGDDEALKAKVLEYEPTYAAPH
jgi:2',3'-cyclic-nucleotide 2'-phosphodiesterase (5'-nucleotidase family)